MGNRSFQNEYRISKLEGSDAFETNYLKVTLKAVGEHETWIQLVLDAVKKTNLRVTRISGKSNDHTNCILCLQK